MRVASGEVHAADNRFVTPKDCGQKFRNCKSLGYFVWQA
jgi:hypothetical protein